MPGRNIKRNRGKMVKMKRGGSKMKSKKMNRGKKKRR